MKFSLTKQNLKEISDNNGWENPLLLSKLADVFGFECEINFSIEDIFKLKNQLKEIIDKVPSTYNSKSAGWQVYDRGILICGSGYGMSIAANRHPLVRAVVCRSAKEAEMARLHNDANVLCLGADFTTTNQAKKICKAFFTTKFEGGRHKKRIQSIGNY